MKTRISSLRGGWMLIALLFFAGRISAQCTANAGGDQTICAGQSVVLGGAPTASGGSGNYTYSWSNISINADLANPTVTPNGTTTYVVTVDDGAGCITNDSVTISVTALPIVNGGADKEACLNGPNVVLPSAGSWSGASMVTAAGVFTPNAIGTFNLIVTATVNGCSNSDQVDVVVHPLPLTNAGADQFICQGQTAQLNASATSPNGAITLFTWSGGTVSNSLIANPTATPSNTTTYNVTAVDIEGCSDPDQVTVFILTPPNVNAGADHTFCLNDPPTQLTGFSPAGGSWTGSYVNSGGVFTPTTSGTFTLSYSFTNAQGCTATDQVEITVNAAAPVNAGNDADACLDDAPFQLTPVDAGGSWSGSSMVTTSGLFTPSSSGDFILTYQVGSGNCISSDQIIVHVDPLPSIDAGIDQDVCSGEPVTILNAFSPSGGTWSGTGIADNVNGTFDPEVGLGTYTLTYSITDINTNCTATDTKQITVAPLPVANFILPVQGCTNVNTIPDNTSNGAVQYEWQVNNNPVIPGFEPALVFGSDGNYSVNLIAENSQGCTSTVSHDIEIFSAPDAVFDLSVSEGCAPLNVSFTNLSTGEYLTYNWDLGIDISSDFEPLSLVYNEDMGITNYDITLSVSNICGTDSDDESLIVHPRPKAEFSTDVISTMCSPVTVDFVNTSEGNPESCVWTFGDGTNSMITDPEQNVYYTDQNPTDYTIWLYVENACGEDSVMQVLTVQPNLVNASFITNSNSGCTPFGIEISDQSIGATDITFDIGGFFTSNLNDVNYTFTDAGSFTIFQYATDGCGSDTTELSVEVLQSPVVDFILSTSETCVGSEIVLESEIEGAQSFEWNLGDGNLSTSEVVTHNYTAENTYNITLTAVAPNLCTAIATEDLDVWENPVASFNTNGTVFCSPADICFENTSVGATDFEWTFGDGSASSLMNPCHAYLNQTGITEQKEIVLEATNSHGCNSSITFEIQLNPEPVSNFTLPSASTCELPVTIYPVAESTDEPSYEWLVNGEPVSGDVSPGLFFESTGAFVINLTVTSIEGCASSTDQTFIAYPKPVAAFDADEQLGCVDFEANFINNSSGAVVYAWDFGNGITSSDFNPQVVYDVDGFFDVSLIAISVNGCEDTMHVADYIQTFPLPVAEFTFSPEETSIFFPEVTVSSVSENADLVIWDFGDGGFSDAENEIHSYANPGEYEITLNITSFYGCQDEVSHMVTITNELMVYIPNSFTPDNDGRNDLFIPELAGKEIITDYEFRIFDRWGSKIFETNDPFTGWMGNVKNGEYYAPAGIYVYELFLKPGNSTPLTRYSGNVTLIR